MSFLSYLSGLGYGIHYDVLASILKYLNVKDVLSCMNLKDNVELKTAIYLYKKNSPPDLEVEYFNGNEERYNHLFNLFGEYASTLVLRGYLSANDVYHIIELINLYCLHLKCIKFIDTIDEPYLLSDEKMCDILIKVRQPINTLYFNMAMFTGNGLKRCTNIEHLYITNCNVQEYLLNQFLKNNKNLKTLLIETDTNFNSISLTNELINCYAICMHWENITSLTLRTPNIRNYEALGNLRELAELRIESHPTLNTGPIIALLAGFNKLEILELTLSHELAAIEYSSIKGYTNLKQLKLIVYACVNVVEALKNLTNNRNLTDINLTIYKSCFDVAAIIPHIQHIKKFVVCFKNKVTNLVDLGKLEKLTHLDLHIRKIVQKRPKYTHDLYAMLEQLSNRGIIMELKIKARSLLHSAPHSKRFHFKSLKTLSFTGNVQQFCRKLGRLCMCYNLHLECMSTDLLYMTDLQRLIRASPNLILFTLDRIPNKYYKREILVPDERRNITVKLVSETLYYLTVSFITNHFFFLEYGMQ